MRGSWKIAGLSALAMVWAGCRTPEPITKTPGPIITSDGPGKSSVTVSTAAASTVTPNSANSFKPFGVYGHVVVGKTHYVPSGYMGDSDLTLSAAMGKSSHGDGQVLKANYRAKGPKGWVGLYWQDPANNWGDKPGQAGYDLRGATRLTFLARGEKGGERIHEFRVGGIVGKYPDSDVATLSGVRLSPEWKEYSIDLSKKDLRHIIGGFGFFLNKVENPGGAVFYLDDIQYQGPENQATQPETTAPPLQGKLPVETTVQHVIPVVVSTPPAIVPAAKDLQVKEVETGLKVSFSSRLMFRSGQAILEPVSGKVLDQLILLLNAYPKNRVLIEGHTDNTGDKDFNLKLSELRAKSVRDYLIKNGGYKDTRFQVVGYGDTKPIADNGTSAGRAINRRVEVTILKNPK